MKEGIHPNYRDVVFVDLRDIRELWREGTVPNSFHAPRGMLEFWVDSESPYAKDVFKQPKKFVFFCAAGWRSALSTATVKEMGLENVAHIDGGFSAWKAAGGPVAPVEPVGPCRPCGPGPSCSGWPPRPSWVRIPSSREAGPWIPTRWRVILAA